MNPSARRSLAIALVIVPLAAALAPLALPPFVYPLVIARIALAAIGPPTGVAAIALGAVAVRLARGAPRLRRALAAGALAAAVVALLPAVASMRLARGAPTGGLDPLFGVVHPLPVPPSVAERVGSYRADDGTPLVSRQYRDTTACVRPCPTVVVLYAGAWLNGRPSQGAPIHRWLAGRGYVVVALDYRHAPAHRFPAQLDDVRRGLAVVRDSALAWRVDTRRVALWGRSSGGHLAALTAWSSGADALPLRVRGVIDFYGPFDLARGYYDRPTPDPIDGPRVLRAFLGGPPDAMPSRYRDASPRSWVRPGLPPTLLVYGGGDHVVKPEFGRAEAAALRASGDPVEFVEMPWAEHAFDLAAGGPQGTAALRIALRFLSRVL